MNLGITDTQNYSDIADAIRAKNGTANTYTPSQMAPAILAIPSGGGGDSDFVGEFIPFCFITEVTVV